MEFYFIPQTAVRKWIEKLEEKLSISIEEKKKRNVDILNNEGLIKLLAKGNNMNESEVKSQVTEYFKENGYCTLKEFDLDCVSKALKVDVVAFKWSDEYDIEAIAVECKGEVGIHTLVDTIYNQLREYQAGFPAVYLAIPEKTKEKVLRDLLESYGMGLLTIGDEIKEEIPPNPENCAPKLNLNIHGYSVRQKLAAYMTLHEITKKNEISCTHASNFGFACWENVDEISNYCIYNDVFLNREYHLSIVIEKKDNVEKALKKANPQDLYNLLRNLPEDFLFSVYRVFGVTRARSYKLVLKGPIRDLNKEFLDWLIEFAKRNDYKIAINVGRKIWSIDEFLPESKHLERAKEVMKHLEPVKQYFEKL